MMPFSSSSSLSLSSIFKRRWENQNVPALFYSFLGGYIGHVYLRLQKRREHMNKVDKIYDDYEKRYEELSNRFDRYLRGDYD